MERIFSSVWYIEACGLVVRMLDSRSKGLGSISSAGHLWKCQENFSFCTASAHPAVMVTCWNEKATL